MASSHRSTGPRVISPLPAPVRAAYLDACRAAVPSIVVDFRASAGVDARTR